MKDEYNDGTLPEYNLKGKKGIRAKYGKITSENATVEIVQKNGEVTTRPFMAHDRVIYLSSDVQEFFPNSEEVNEALRALIPLLRRAKAHTE